VLLLNPAQLSVQVFDLLLRSCMVRAQIVRST
jgi:hypothetical protein